MEFSSQFLLWVHRCHRFPARSSPGTGGPRLKRRRLRVPAGSWARAPGSTGSGPRRGAAPADASGPAVSPGAGLGLLSEASSPFSCAPPFAAPASVHHPLRPPALSPLPAPSVTFLARAPPRSADPASSARGPRCDAPPPTPWRSPTLARSPRNGSSPSTGGSARLRPYRRPRAPGVRRGRVGTLRRTSPRGARRPPREFLRAVAGV